MQLLDSFSVRENRVGEFMENNKKPYSEELYHYGVIGMKWGVRRKGYDKYVAKAEKHEARAAEALAAGKKHKYFKNSDKAKDYRYMAKTAKRMQETKGIINRHNVKWGYSAKADRIANKAAKWDDRGENRRFRFTRASANKKASIVRRTAKIFDAYANTPIRTMGGRMRTADQQKAERTVSNIMRFFGANNVATVYDVYKEYKGYFKNNK